MTRGGRILGALALAGWTGAVPGDAAQVKIFRSQSAEAFLKGEAAEVAIESGGVLRLAPRARRLAAIDAPFAFALARTETGWAVGTGNDGQVLAVAEDGRITTLYDAPESEVFALAVDRDGALLAGTSPHGKVHRLEAGGARELFSSSETYIWALARDREGALWVATGGPGRLYRLSSSGTAETIWEGGADHVRCLLALDNGDLLFGTAGDGRLLRWRAGEVRTLLDSELNEIVALAPSADGAVWVAVLSSEASFVDLTPRPPASGESADGAQPVVTVEESATLGSRTLGSRGPRSELWRLQASGATEKVWSSVDETIFAMLADGGRLWMGTGLEGRLYALEDGRARVEKEFEAKQVVALAPAREGPVALTTNGAALWALTSSREARGTYTSAPLDAGQVSRFGTFRWTGEAPAGTSIRASFRTGFSAEPDATWSAWSAPREGPEVALTDVDRGRYAQYRLELVGRDGESPRIVSTELSYRQENLRPAIETFAAMEPGQILVPSGFNPADQLFEPASPNREGIFETLAPSTPRDERLKPVFKKGWRTLQWSASDPNGDELWYRLEVRPESDAAGWLELADEVEGTSFAFDATALPDGVYRFRVTASDEPSNGGAAAALTAVRESEPVALDQTPPELRSVERRGGERRVEVRDLGSPLRAAEASIDGGEWKEVRTEDGLLDGREETLIVSGVPDAARLVLLRLTDTSFNVRTFDLGASEVKR